MNNYDIGVLKRKFKTGRADQPPGTFISKMNEQKTTAAKEKKLRTAIMGLT